MADRKAALITSADDQRRRFEEAARELGCDESEERFDAALRKVVKHKPKEAEPAVEQAPPARKK
jgi:hypothetical protein